MDRYALISGHVVLNVVESADQPAGWVLCGDAGPGYLYDGSTFSPPAAHAAIVITSITPDAAHLVDTQVTALNDVTCPAGTVLTVQAELQRDGVVLPVTDRFRMPLRARDGREKVLLAEMVDGLITITVPLRDSGAWAVTETMINEDLPPAAQMGFGGFRLFVTEA